MLNLIKEEELLIKEKLGYFFNTYSKNNKNGVINYLDLYISLTPSERAIFIKYLKQLKKDDDINYILSQANKFDILKDNNKLSYIVANILYIKYLYAKKIKKEITKKILKTTLNNFIEKEINNVLRNNIRISTIKIFDNLNINIINKKTYKDIEKDLKKIYNTDIKKIKILSETTKIRAQTAQIYDSLIDRNIKYYQYVAMADCCKLCATLNNKIFLTNSLLIGINAPPLHPNCRCRIIPVI